MGPTEKARSPACAQENQAFLLVGHSARWAGLPFRATDQEATVVPEIGERSKVGEE